MFTTRANSRSVGHAIYLLFCYKETRPNNNRKDKRHEF